MGDLAGGRRRIADLAKRVPGLGLAPRGRGWLRIASPEEEQIPDHPELAEGGHAHERCLDHGLRRGEGSSASGPLSELHRAIHALADAGVS